MFPLIRKCAVVGLDSTSMIFQIIFIVATLVLTSKLLIVPILINRFLLTTKITSLISDIFDRGILRATYISLHLASTTFQEPSVFFVVQNLCTLAARGLAHL